MSPDKILVFVFVLTQPRTAANVPGVILGNTVKPSVDRPASFPKAPQDWKAGGRSAPATADRASTLASRLNIKKSCELV